MVLMVAPMLFTLRSEIVQRAMIALLLILAETVTWDASPSPGVDRYHLYYSSTGKAPWSIIWNGNALSAPGSRNTKGTNWYYATASKGTNESIPSNIAFKVQKQEHIKASP